MILFQNKYNEAILLRKQGCSIKNIARQLKISSSTASIWCRDIELTSLQKLVLADKSKNIEILRRYSQKRKEEKFEKYKTLFNEAQKDLKKLKLNEFFIAGLALYWAEGFKSKSEKTVGFCNSDPLMVKFMIQWFKQFFSLTNDDFILRVEFNSKHEYRQEEIENYWSNLTSIPRIQFNKPYLQQVNKQKEYINSDNYYGLVRIRIRKSTNMLITIRGWLYALPQVI